MTSSISVPILNKAVVAEWLRRLTRNQFPSGSVGSNPTDCEFFDHLKGIRYDQISAIDHFGSESIRKIAVQIGYTIGIYTLIMKDLP